MKVVPDQEEFCRLAEQYNIIPVYVDLPLDMETPVTLYYKIVGENPGFMLESAESSKAFGRYSFIGADPFMSVSVGKGGLEVETGTGRQLIAGAPLTALQGILDGFSFPAAPELPPFCGGAVGYLAYEIVATWERIRGMEIGDNELLGQFMLCRTIVAMDHLTHTAKLICLVPVTDAAKASGEYGKARVRLAGLLELLKRPLQLPAATKPDRTTAASPGDEELSRERFLAQVAAAKEYIAAGDIFQVVLSRPFRRKTAEHPFSLYRRLRRVNPSPYMFYINFGAHQLVGASPEMLVKVREGRVFSCPIAGTRPRGEDAAEDARLAEELLADIKERAEHAMLVDLSRNDIGRVSLPGTVEVSRMMEVEQFSHVMHIVSEVTGQLQPGCSSTDVLTACFPAGTLSGAPKVRAMEIIDQLEGERRGAYGGAVGYIDFRGNMDTCITIRTIAMRGGEAVIQTGAGIVADSQPETEYRETLHKAAAMLRVLEGE